METQTIFDWDNIAVFIMGSPSFVLDPRNHFFNWQILILKCNHLLILTAERICNDLLIKHLRPAEHKPTCRRRCQICREAWPNMLIVWWSLCPAAAGAGGGGGEGAGRGMGAAAEAAADSLSGLALLTLCQSASLQRYLEGQPATLQLWLDGGRERREQPLSSGILRSPTWQKTSRCWTPSPHDAEHWNNNRWELLLKV